MMAVSKSPRKQRKRLAELPLHKRHLLLSATLSPELRKRFNRRNLELRRGDKVKVMTGGQKGAEGQVIKVNLDPLKVYVDKVTVKKRDGSDTLRPVQPSNLMITDIDLRDKMRQRVLERKVSREVVEKEVKREEAERKKAEELEARRKAEEERKAAEKKAAEEAKKKAEEAKEGKPAKKSTETEQKKVSEKGIKKELKKDWIKEK